MTSGRATYEQCNSSSSGHLVCQGGNIRGGRTYADDEHINLEVCVRVLLLCQTLRPTPWSLCWFSEREKSGGQPARSYRPRSRSPLPGRRQFCAAACPLLCGPGMARLVQLAGGSDIGTTPFAPPRTKQILASLSAGNGRVLAPADFHSFAGNSHARSSRCQALS